VKGFPLQYAMYCVCVSIVSTKVHHNNIYYFPDVMNYYRLKKIFKVMYSIKCQKTIIIIIIIEIIEQ